MINTTYGEKFNRCLTALLENEGSYCCLKGDPGGRTWFGITETYDKETFDRILTAPDDDTRIAYAATRYYDAYWQPMHCPALPLRLAFRCFDAAVLCGVGGATKFLQQAVNMSGRYALLIDGGLGPKTLAATLALAIGEERNLIGWMTFFEGQHFEALVDSMPQFIWGWGRRLGEPNELWETET